MTRQMIMGNQAIALGALKAGVNLVAGYPGTPSSEIIEFIAKYKEQTGTYVEWSVNEKAAAEVAAGASYAGSRTLITMKQVGLNVASDPVMCLSYVGVKGGMVIVSADDPGPISSQTEQDTRNFAQYSKLPCFDPSTPLEAYEMIQEAFELSEKYNTPVLLRPTTRVDHAYESMDFPELGPCRKPGVFEKDSRRWVIFPRASYNNHKRIFERNEKILPVEFSKSKWNYVGGSLPLGCTSSQPTPSPRGAAPKTPAAPLASDSLPEQDPSLPGHGRTVLITAGRTEEAIDPVRYISNRSSGKTAVALASVFLANGYSVEVVAGPMEAEFPGGATVHRVRSACDMHQAVMERLSGADALVHCAAVADYRPKDPAQSKIKDSRSQLVLELVPNPNILRDSVAAKKPNQVVVGFALETDHFEEHAQKKLQKSGADALLLNAPVAKDSGFGFDNVNYALVTPGEKIPEMQMGSKVELSETIVDFVNRKLEERHG